MEVTLSPPITICVYYCLKDVRSYEAHRNRIDIKLTKNALNGENAPVISIITTKINDAL
uniref:Uncharacterized protein n=1 Tax=Magnetococcus massalia (strain MO-1) TaxID=451514 RepID=A0A1S7LML1_MAGMO|nr:protein of unknown function [Candidatus Magnetococcus massalia]